MLYRDLGYEPTQFVPITMLAKNPDILVVRKDLPATTLKELIDYGKANPGKLSYASQGVGSTAHLSAAQLEVEAGIKMVHVPYRGAQPALTDVVAGHVDMFFDTLATSVPLYRENKVQSSWAWPISTARACPEVPTISEAGLPGFQARSPGSAWSHRRAHPRRWPKRSNRDVVEILKRPRRSATSLRRVARRRRNHARRDGAILCRRDGVVEQGDQGGGDRAAIAADVPAPAAEDGAARSASTVAHVNNPASR